MGKLVLIDGNAIMHRAFHAMPKLTSKTQTPINAVYGLTSMLLRIIVDLKPTHLAVCFDRPEPTFRKKLLKSYQAQRPEMDNDLTPQFKPAKDILKTMRISVFEKAGYEADDLIGTIAAKTTEKTKSSINQVIIVTGDRDILQLVDDDKNIKLYMPVKGLTEAKLFDEKQTYERMGVKSSQIVDYKALVGDPSDNYPGVKGIGPKTAEDLLTRYKSKAEIYKHLSEINEKTRKLLIDNKKNADLSYKLAKIITNVPIKVDSNQMGKWNVYNPSVENIFSEIGFKTLKKRAQKVAEEKIGEAQGNLF